MFETFGMFMQEIIMLAGSTFFGSPVSQAFRHAGHKAQFEAAIADGQDAEAIQALAVEIRGAQGAGRACRLGSPFRVGASNSLIPVCKIPGCPSIPEHPQT